MTRPLQTTAAVTAAIAALLLAGCGKDEPLPTTPAAAPPAVAASASLPTSAPPSTPTTPRATRPPSVAVAKAPRPTRRNVPRKVRRGDVEKLARRFTRAWITLELGNGDPNARRELAATITPQYAAELSRLQLQPREDRAELVDVDVIQHPGSARRWTAVVRLMRHGATEYLQPEIARRDGRLVVTGLSW